MQDVRNEDDGNAPHDKTAYKGNGHRRMKGMGNFPVLISGANIVGNEDIDANGNPNQHVDEEKDG